MSSDIGLVELRDEVLRKIGRNVVNFQKMEGMLKLLTAHHRVRGPIKGITRIAARARKATARQPMGRLADAVARSVFSNAPDPGAANESGEASVSFSFRIEADAAELKKRRKALTAVVQERNRLIHQWLAALDPNSIASLRTLRTALDEQHVRITPEFENLRAIFEAFSELRDELKRYIASNEFLQGEATTQTC